MLGAGFPQCLIVPALCATYVCKSKGPWSPALNKGLRMSRLINARPLSIALPFMLLTMAVVISACGGSGDSIAPPAPPPPPPPATVTNVSGVIGTNHPLPHTVVITAAELTAGVGLTRDIQGQAFHSHTIVLTSAMISQIAAKVRVSVESSTDPHSDGTGAHSHTVTFG